MPTIKEAIKEMKMEPMEVALKLQVSYATVYKWIKDDYIPKGPASLMFWRLYEERPKSN